VLPVKIPPVVVVMITAALMWLASHGAPWTCFSLPGRHLIAAGIGSVGVLVALIGIAAFRRARTTVDPTRPEAASSLVCTGIYAYTRNPMYLGFLLILAAWAVLLSNLVALALLPAFVLYLNRTQISFEEEALAARFGREFADYKSRVRRWL
jgi:protein-S-isoprenylcysteine O-methyltransferase Ste14